MNIDDIIFRIIDGQTYRTIAKDLNVPLSTLFDFIHKPEHSARAREALKLSADVIADKAEEVLKEAKGTLTEVTRARELAQYYKWKSSKRNPGTYGDKVDMNHTGDLTIRKIEVEIVKPKDYGSTNPAD
jgi:FixJ family two-component response regulator